ncbi:hypothetical protein QCA50_015177 [Cerrena zonata]|uniref:Uncharacterized protein n=1 Tax=Cerrena zonata TaxID=2478898 RepID=A0AAW0FSI0_9APHY
MYLRDGINIALEALVIGITLFRTLGLREEASKAGVKVSIGDLLLQDGSLQFGIILLFSILDISMIKTLGEPIPTIIIKSIITSHFAFHLRQVHLGSSSNQTQTRSLMSSLRFTVVGNVGAPVHNVFSESQNDMNPEGDVDEVQFSNDPISTILEIPISSSPQGEV